VECEIFSSTPSFFGSGWRKGIRGRKYVWPWLFIHFPVRKQDEGRDAVETCNIPVSTKFCRQAALDRRFREEWQHYRTSWYVLNFTVFSSFLKENKDFIEPSLSIPGFPLTCPSSLRDITH